MMKRFKFLTLAALLVVPLAACDEGDDTVAPVANGSVTGTVTIDGTPAAGVTVALSNGANATTAATGTYTFSDVPLGAYTVTISGFPSDVAFQTTTQAAVIATSGQAVIVNFAGSRITTSSIFGSVTSGTTGLAGVTVTLSGAASRNTTTDAAGQYSIPGLPAGSYTVTLSGIPAGQACSNNPQSVTLTAGESKVASFTCTATAAGTISGRLFLDENNKNDMYDGPALEETLMAANVAITLEGPSIGNVQTMQTQADGTFSFPDLTPGTYNVTIDPADPEIPSDVTYGGASTTFTRTVEAGTATPPVNFPFDITNQEIKVYAFLGRDASPPPAGISTEIPTGVAPAAGVILDLYPTEADAVASTNRLGRDTTDAAGETQFNFLREDDTSPGGAVPDQIVFAQFVAAPDAFHALNGETRIEIRYEPRFASSMAADTFDLLNTRVVMKFDAVGETTLGPLEGWNAALWLNDTLADATQTTVTNADGEAVFADAVSAASLPDTFYMRLSGSQPTGSGFIPTPVAQEGTVQGSFLRFIHLGTSPATDTVDVGDMRVRFSTSDVMVRVYHERDDSVAGGPPRMSSGDNIENADNIDVTLTWQHTGAVTDSSRTLTAAAADGVATFVGVPTNEGPYTLSASSTVAFQTVLEEDTLMIGTGGLLGDLGGSTQATRVCPLGEDTAAGCATFAFKYNNGVINGKVKANDSTAAAGLIVTMTPTAGTIEGTAAMTDTTDADGLFSFGGLMEGAYTVAVNGNATWEVIDGPIVDTVQGNGDIDILSFHVRRLDTSIRGVVVNDRDQDTNVIDPNEALSGVIMNLYADSVTATPFRTATTGTNGEYTFDDLPEGRYIVQALQPGTAVVTRGIDAAGAHRDTAHVTTAATTVGEGNNNTRTVGTTSPVPLPRWDYSTSTVFFDGRTNFTFLFNDTEARGVITLADMTPVQGMTVNIRRCDDSPVPPAAGAAESPPVAGTCTTYYPNSTPIPTTTDATGLFSYTNLQEGVYEVTPNAASAGLTATAPTQTLFLLVGPGDIERGDFVAN